MSVSIDRHKTYDEAHCWQYSIRVRNLDEDLQLAGITKAVAESLKVSDFEISYVDKLDKTGCKQVEDFILRHEWLGKMPQRPTHRFIATYKGIPAGVIVMATPNAFSNLLGVEYRSKEKLISRGACISWSPKNLASHLIMWSIKWMAKNTEYRIFTAYSDPEARELGTVYQACNFIYLGKTSGAAAMYFDPQNPERGWFSDRDFRKIGRYRQYAKEHGVIWDAKWNDKWTIHWDIMPQGIEKMLRSAAKAYQAKCQVREVPAKHKYCYLLGENKKETKILHRLLKDKSPDRVGLSYPTERGQ